MQSESIEASDWWARPRGATSKEWVGNYQRSLQARHRSAIVEVVTALGAETVLEVGAHCGPNLVRLAQELPHLRAIGVDVSQEAVLAGRQWVASLGLTNRVQLNAGRIPEATANTPSGCVDVVLSCYALAYVAPADLDAVLFEMGRLATKAVVIAEPMVMTGPAANNRSLSGYSEWAHNYQNASQWIGSWAGMAIETHPVSPSVDRLNGILVAVRP